MAADSPIVLFDSGVGGLTVLGAMRKHDAKRGIATLCIGGGEAVAVAFERD